MKTAQAWAVVVILFASSLTPARTAATSGTTRFVLDGNRVYAEVAFIRPNGIVHRALAFVDMGSPSVVLTGTLFKQLQIDRGNRLNFRIGELPVSVPAREVSTDGSEAYVIGDHLKVEGVLPAGLMQRYQVVLDYERRKMTLARPGVIPPQGDAVPFRINPRTGLIAVDVQINHATYAMTIDNGSAYTWLRQATAMSWLAAHPDWKRGVGAVGASNMMMSGTNAESNGILMRIPEMEIGPVKLRQVGVLAAGESTIVDNQKLFDWYSAKNPVPVIGWIGGSVLKDFRLTIDYPNRVIYWQRQIKSEPGELDQVGLTLAIHKGQYIVARVATKQDKPTVNGVEPGDTLLRIDKLETKSASWGQIYDAMHGKPGDKRVLLLQRGARQFTVNAKVTAF